MKTISKFLSLMQLTHLFSFLLFALVMSNTAISQTATPSTVCYGCPVQLSCGSFWGCGLMGSSYFWTCNTSAWTSNLENPSLVPTVTDTYTLEVFTASAGYYKGSVTVFVNPPMSLSASTVPASCTSGSIGSLDLTVSGGCGPFAYQWDNGVLTEDNYIPSCGVNSVTVTDLCGTQTGSWKYEDIIIEASICDAGPYCQGSIDLTVSCGTAPYRFFWNNAATTEDISGLCSSSSYSYCVLVEDAHNLSKYCCWSITKTQSSCQANYLQNIDVPNGNEDCFDASQNLYVAGNGTTFHVDDGGTATMIAGEKISYFYGTRVFQGGSLHGYITTNGQFCGARKSDGGVNSKGISSESPHDIIKSENQWFTVYPNPTAGNLILELGEDVNPANVKVDIYAMRGEKVLSSELNGERKREFSLSDKPSGIYFIRVITGKQTGNTKILKR